MKKYLFIVVVSFAIILVLRASVSEDKEVFSQIIKEMGYDDVSENPYEVVEFTIPETFNDVYTRYNNLLKESGYDLSPYKGKACKRYTYLIPSQNARANIIVYDGNIIGGDISGITLDGIMFPIKRKSQS